jgi:hypothetical protein
MNPTTVDYDHLVPVEEMAGQDFEETEQLRESLEEAKAFLRSHHWCRSIRRELFGLGVGGVVRVFLFELVGDPGVDEVLWVVTGDVPPAYLVTDGARTPVAALEVYCGLMEAWIDAVRRKADPSEAFPVSVEPTEKNAALLEKRVWFLRREIVPAFE